MTPTEEIDLRTMWSRSAEIQFGKESNIKLTVDAMIDEYKVLMTNMPTPTAQQKAEAREIVVDHHIKGY